MEELEVKQTNLMHLIMSSFVNSDSDSFKQLINELAVLRGEKPMDVAFAIAQSLNQENLKLIENRRREHAVPQSD